MTKKITYEQALMTGAGYFSVVFNPYRCMLNKITKKWTTKKLKNIWNIDDFFLTDNDFFYYEIKNNYLRNK